MSRSERETERPTARLLAKCRHRVSAKPTSACGYLVSERLKADGGRMALLPKAGIGKFLALKSRWNCARLFISARPLSSARKGDFAHCSVARGARSVPPVSDAPSPPVPFFLTPPEGAGGTPSYRRWAYGGLWCKRFEVEPSRRREVALDHAARTAFQILGAVLPLVPSLPSLN